MAVVSRSRNVAAIQGPLAVFTLSYDVKNQSTFTGALQKTQQAQAQATASSKNFGLEQEKNEARLAAVMARYNALFLEQNNLIGSIDKMKTELMSLDAVYQAQTYRLTMLTQKLEAAKVAQNPQKIGAYTGLIAQLNNKYGDMFLKVEQDTTGLQKMGSRLEYVSAQVKIKEARISELNDKLQIYGSQTQQATAKNQTFGQSFIAALKNTFSSWANFSKAVDTASVTLDRYTRSATRGVKLANAFSMALRGKPLIELSTNTKKAADATENLSVTQQVAKKSTDVFSASLQAAGGGMGKVAFIIENLSDTISQTIGQLAADALENIVSGVINLGKAAVEPVLQFEKLHSSMTALVAQQMMNADASLSMADALQLSASKATQLLNWLQQLAIFSPFSVDDIKGAFLFAQAMGFNADEAQRLTEATVNWAAATGREGDAIQTVISALGKMRVQGKITGQDILELARAGISFDQIMAKAMNKSTAEIADMRSKGILPVEKAMDTLVAQMEKDWGEAAKNQSQTIQGLISSAQDLGQGLLRNIFGPMNQVGKVEGILGALQTRLAKVVDFLNSTPVQNAAIGFGRQMGDLANKAFSWGENLVSQFAKGMVAAINQVLQAIAYIANMITYYMAPGSPPKMLPDIDKWGKSALEQFMKGFSDIQSDMFTQLGGDMEQYLRSISTDAIGDVNLVPAIMKMRVALAQAIQGNGGVKDIIASLGDAGKSLSTYITALYNLQKANQVVENAQNNLNKVTDTYDTKLKGLNDKLDALKQADQDAADAKTITKLTRIAGDEGASPARRAAAQRELDEMALEKQIRLTETQKTKAVDAAQAKLDAAQKNLDFAQKQYDLEKLMMDSQEHTNDLLKEQAKLLDKLADAMDKMPKLDMGSGTPDIQDAMPGGLGKLPKPSKQAYQKSIQDMINDAFGASINTVNKAFDKLKLTLEKKFQPLTDKWHEFTGAVADFGGVIQKHMPTAEKEFSRFIAGVGNEWAKFGPTIVTGLTVMLTSLSNFWDKYGDRILQGLVDLGIAIVKLGLEVFILAEMFVIGLGQMFDVLIEWDKLVIKKWNEFWKDLHDLWDGAVKKVKKIWSDALDALHDFVTETIPKIKKGIVDFLDEAHDKFVSVTESVKLLWSQAIEALRAAAEAKWKEITKLFTDKLGEIETAITGEYQTLYNLGTTIVDGLKQGVIDTAHKLIEAITGAVSDAIAAARALLGNPKSPSPVTRAKLGRPFMEGIQAGMEDAYPAARDSLASMVNGMVTPPSSGQQISNSSYNSNVTENYNYSPTYGAAPQSPQRDFGLMRVLR